MPITEEQLNNTKEAIKSEVSQLQELIKNGTERTKGEIKELEERFKGQIDDIEGKLKNFQFVDNANVINNDEDSDQKKSQRIAEFESKMNKEFGRIANVYGKHPNPLMRKLYSPRVIWDKKNFQWKLKGSYDGMEELMDLHDQVLIYGFAQSLKQNRPYDVVVKENDLYKFWLSELTCHPEMRSMMKAMNTTDNADIIPTQMSASMIDDVRLQLKVAGLFRQLNLPRSNYEAPLRGPRIRAYLVSEPTADDATKIGARTVPTSKISFSAITMGVRVLFSDDLEIDSIVPILPFVTEEVRQAIADGKEDAIINGDSSTTHQDSDVTLSTDLRKAFSGLRYLSGGSSGVAAVDISTLSLDNLRSIRKAMGRFGVMPTDLAWITSISAYIQMLGIDQVETVDKYGPSATVLNGELGKLDGIPIIVSEFVRQDLNTSGVYDGSTTTDTILMLVNRPSFMIGSLRNQRTEVERIIATQQTQVVTTEKFDFKEVITPGSSEETVGLGYSLTA